MLCTLEFFSPNFPRHLFTYVSYAPTPTFLFSPSIHLLTRTSLTPLFQLFGHTSLTSKLYFRSLIILPTIPKPYPLIPHIDLYLFIVCYNTYSQLMDFFNALYFSYLGQEDLFRFEPSTTTAAPPPAVSLPSTASPSDANTSLTVHHIHTHTHVHTHTHSCDTMGAHYSTITPHMHMEITNNQANNNQSNGTKSAFTHVKVQHHPSYWIQFSLICIGIAVGVYLFFLLAKYLNKKFGCCVCCLGTQRSTSNTTPGNQQINSMEMGFLPTQRFPPVATQPAFSPQQLMASPIFSAAQAMLPPGVSTGVNVAANALTAAANKAALPPRAASVAAMDISQAQNQAVQQAWGSMLGQGV